jgi:hypothetical protein
MEHAPENCDCLPAEVPLPRVLLATHFCQGNPLLEHLASQAVWAPVQSLARDVIRRTSADRPAALRRGRLTVTGSFVCPIICGEYWIIRWFIGKLKLFQYF